VLTKRQTLQGGAGVLGGILLYGVWRDFRPDPLAGRAKHEAGFSVAVPDGFEVRRPAGKLKIMNFDRTQQKWIKVYAATAGRSGKYSASIGPTRRTPAGQARYRLTESTETKGMWELQAELAYGFHWIYFHAVESGSPTQPGFGFAWQVIGSVRT